MFAPTYGITARIVDPYRNRSPLPSFLWLTTRSERRKMAGLAGLRALMRR